MIEGLIVTIGIGILIIVLGAINMTGNISSLHSYHRHRVSEEDKKPFGRLVGLGTVLCGVSIVLLGIFSFVTAHSIFATVGLVASTVLLITGIGISFYAMIKYNKGIF